MNLENLVKLGFGLRFEPILNTVRAIFGFESEPEPKPKPKPKSVHIRTSARIEIQIVFDKNFPKIRLMLYYEIANHKFWLFLVSEEF